MVVVSLNKKSIITKYLNTALKLFLKKINIKICYSK